MYVCTDTQSYHLQEVMRSVTSQLEVELLHNDEFHPLNISLREFTAVTLHQQRQQRFHSLESTKLPSMFHKPTQSHTKYKQSHFGGAEQT